MLLQVIFVIAVAAEAMTAALAAGRRKMDWFGVCVLAAVTALGGGTMRDTLLGHYPLSWVANPLLLLDAAAAALFTIAIARFMDRLRWPFLLLDALGLVVFTVLGCDVALEMGLSPIIVIVAGMITGIAGGQGRLIAQRLGSFFRIAGVDRSRWDGAPAGMPMHVVDLRKRKFEDVFRTERPDAVTGREHGASLLATIPIPMASEKA